ncbi:MoxR family ATPase [Candidatus Gracilibacteria bacterium 28_42_T64]|nr:MoxR family ATPase [Candidatus Gracilibacteria bacterium 28_42_T64]
MESKNIQEKIQQVKTEIAKKVVGQENLVRDLLIGLFSQGHVLLEGAPGLAKTLAVATLSKVVDLNFKRIQFTPDLLPSDLIGAKIYNQEKQDFQIKKGPIFTNIVLADEINRSPSKVQSALLEAMAEKQVTIGDKSYKLSEPFMVLATQNPLEQSGTYSLPEAQLDRFLLKTIVNYPNETQEIEIMKQYASDSEVNLDKVLSKKELLEIQKQAESIFVNDHIYEYVKDLVFYTRNQDFMKKYLAIGASPRASIALIKTAKILALLDGRDFVLPEDIKEMIYPVMRHRIILSYESIAEGVTTDDVITEILSKVSVQ